MSGKVIFGLLVVIVLGSCFFGEQLAQLHLNLRDRYYDYIDRKYKK